MHAEEAFENQPSHNFSFFYVSIFALSLTFWSHLDGMYASFAFHVYGRLNFKQVKIKSSSYGLMTDIAL